MVLVIVAGAGVAVATVVELLARRWPVIEAPRVSNDAIVVEVTRHPGLAAHLRRHFDPKKETGVALIVASAVVSAAAVGIGVLLFTIRAKLGFRSIDYRLATYAAEQATDLSTEVMRKLSLLGGTSGAIGLAAVAGAIEYVRRPTRALPVFLAVVIAGQFALSNGIKLLVERARPDVGRLTGFAGTSFPSGHSTAASATLAALALIMSRGRSRRAKAALAAVAGGLAVVVALTRVFLGVHWFTDVVAGLLLGWGWFAFCSIAFGGRLLSFGSSVAAAENVADTVGAAPTRT